MGTMFSLSAHGPLLGAFLFGAAGSLHCLAMCGGVAGMALLLHDARPAQVRWMLGWQLGRLASYSLLGAVAGGLGWMLQRQPWMGVLQGVLVGLTSAALVLSGSQLMGYANPLARLEGAGVPGFLRLLPLVARWMPPRTPLRALLMGGLWGLVPCGFLYTMLAAAATLGTPARGAAAMACFAVGTMPLLWMTAGGIQIGLLRRGRLRWCVGLAVALTGVVGLLNWLAGPQLLAWICA